MRDFHESCFSGSADLSAETGQSGERRTNRKAHDFDTLRRSVFPDPDFDTADRVLLSAADASAPECELHVPSRVAGDTLRQYRPGRRDTLQKSSMRHKSWHDFAFARRNASK
jgi:hypothetical protein